MCCPLILVGTPPLILVHVEAPYIFVQFFNGKSGLQPHVLFLFFIFTILTLRSQFSI